MNEESILKKYHFGPTQDREFIMERTGLSKDLPSSPWATRFPDESVSFVSGNQNHSALAPRFPRIHDPKYYDQTPSMLPEDRPKTDEDLDLLFATEDMQNESLGGMHTWEASVLSHYARLSPDTIVSGGHRPEDKESAGSGSGLPSLVSPSPSSLSARVSALSIETNEERDLAIYQRERIQVDETRWLPFLRKDRWFDHTEGERDLRPGKTWTVDDPKVWEQLRVVLELANRVLEALIEDKHEGVVNSELTLAERCMVQIDLASTILHEIMHAAFWLRYTDDEYIGNLLDRRASGDQPIEPFFNAEGCAEMGFVMDQLVFGGALYFHPGALPRTRPPVALSSKQFPFDFDGADVVPNSAYMEPGALETLNYIPLAWASKILTESFWRDPAYPKKSENFFHRNFIIVSTTPNNAERCSRPEVRDLGGLPYSYPDDNILVEHWKEKQRLWDHFRKEWYPKAKDEWGHRNLRPFCERFEEAFEKRDLSECTRIASHFSNQIGWNEGRAVFIISMPFPGAISPNWAWHLLGLLMIASIPVVNTQLEEHQTGAIRRYREVSPSKEALAAGRDKTILVPYTDRSGEKKATSTGPIKLYDNIKGTGQLANYDQLTCLDLIDSTMIFIAQETNGVVNLNWFEAIMAATKALRQDRSAISKIYTESHSTRWASSWAFKIPPYSSNLVRWESSSGKWRPYSEEGMV
ncbi:hypothetical protein O1611_g5793 [Lasiodiplodia mahajangana]|uniref:Uncharacterized protein n=1 Tax=Lasiodiplodia mahajangana TaxID=1108764 RepID=A0ACC2JKE3_9PEZI|nr:hypothetical protein O1611_g5793 [Lasiodiplodia mahajangana]